MLSVKTCMKIDDSMTIVCELGQDLLRPLVPKIPRDYGKTNYVKRVSIRKLTDVLSKYSLISSTAKLPNPTLHASWYKPLIPIAHDTKNETTVAGRHL